jgi:hypothetical protein
MGTDILPMCPAAFALYVLIKTPLVRTGSRLGLRAGFGVRRAAENLKVA